MKYVELLCNTMVPIFTTDARSTTCLCFHDLEGCFAQVSSRTVCDYCVDQLFQNKTSILVSHVRHAPL